MDMIFVFDKASIKTELIHVIWVILLNRINDDSHDEHHSSNPKFQNIEEVSKVVAKLIKYMDKNKK